MIERSIVSQLLRTGTCPDVHEDSCIKSALRLAATLSGKDRDEEEEEEEGEI